MTNPMTAAGDMIIGGTAGLPTAIAKGADATLWTMDPTTHLPIWAAPAAPIAGIVPLTALADQATATMVGRVAAGSGPPSALSASDARSAMGLGTIAVLAQGWNFGPALPAQPAYGNGVPFFYTAADYNCDVYYDGTRWLGPEMTIALPTAIAQSTTDGRLFIVDQAVIFQWSLPSYDVLVTGVAVSCYDYSAAPTTTNFHRLTLLDGATTIYQALSFGLARTTDVAMIANATWPLPAVLHSASITALFNLTHEGTLADIYIYPPVITFRRIAT
jgi:hypothetical protein